MIKIYVLSRMKIWNEKVLHLKKVRNVKLLLFSSVTCRTFSQSTLKKHFFSHFLSIILKVKSTRMSKVYKNIWTPKIGERLDTQIEPNNPVEKCAVCTRKSRKVVGHLKKGATGKFAKAIFFFLRGDPY